MYGWIWRKLPFGLPGKLVGSLLIASAMMALLWYVVFPWAEPLLPFDDVQVTQDSGDPAGDVVPGGDGESEPGDGHDLPYDTERNNTPPPSPNE
ncbi:hypothetical protein GA0070606_3170 [Micromonospora citrea]|uniref:Uncharacterized protein n=1 Tax=Micromonospora citrea TaxID=47855 RepID=A0A1C6V0J9_9ACTN|nr:hypothetical protein [Micromonospora citrea]SCL59826.1 hypothetical protein GA0070606_3170 [Micromonospora citrea]